MPNYPVTMSDELYAMVGRYAAKRGITKAEAIRGFMRDGLSNPTPNQRLANVEKVVCDSCEILREHQKTFTADMRCIVSLFDIVKKMSAEVVALRRDITGLGKRG